MHGKTGRSGSITSCTATGGVLAVGAVWRGQQRSGAKSYDVEVRIAGVDEKGDVCGTLTIKHLLPTLPKVVTFFDGEIIGPNHDFITDKWGANEEDDHAHWDRFKRDIYLRGCPVAPSPCDTDTESDCDSQDDDSDGDSASEDSSSTRTRRPRNRSNKNGFSIPRNVVFMRLKERCFLNEGKERDLSEASFDGFYYIAVELNPAPDRPQLSIRKRTINKGRSTSVASPVTRSLLSSSAPTPSTLASTTAANDFTNVDAACGTSDSSSVARAAAFRPSWGYAMTRMNSYASVVRGRTSGTATPPINIPGAGPPHSDITLVNKIDEALLASQCGGTDDLVSYLTPENVFSPSLEEFPFPTSPLATSAPSFAAYRNQVAYFDAGNTFRARSRSSSVRPLSGKQNQMSSGSRTVAFGSDGFSLDGANRLSTNFYNAKTGYCGAFAHATMRGFYFTPPSACTNDGADGNAGDEAAAADDATSTYQELELLYVGDGMGSVLEENEEEQGGVDEWGNLRSVDELEKVKKEFMRRKSYAQPQGLASFSIM